MAVLDTKIVSVAQRNLPPVSNIKEGEVGNFLKGCAATYKCQQDASCLPAAHLAWTYMHTHVAHHTM